MSDKDPIAFISYSREEDEQQDWVVHLSDRLWKDRVETLLDKFSVRYGGNFMTFMETSIQKSDKIIVICTPEYRRKAEERAGGVGYEFSLIVNEIARNISGNEKVIPVLLKGSKETSVPGPLRQYQFIDFRGSSVFEKSYEDLIREIYNELYYKRGEKGKRPEFKERKILVESPSLKITEATGTHQPPKNFSLDYLESLLAGRRFRDADIETLRLFKRYFDKEKEIFKCEFVMEFPRPLFERIDALWRKYSNDRFGFSIQFKIWKELGGQDYSFRIFERFIKQVGWMKDNKLIQHHSLLNFDLAAPEAHLPSLKQSDYEKADWSVAWTDNFKSFLYKQFNK